MTIHKRTRLTPIQRRELVLKYHSGASISELCQQYSVSRPTIYKVLNRSKDNDYSVHKSTNQRFRCLPYGLKRLAKVEAELERKLKNKAKRYNKQYPGEMIHGDTKRLPLITGESPHQAREYLFVAIDDYSRELYAAILPDKTQFSAEKFVKQVVDECPYTIEQFYTDNGLEYKGNPNNHALMMFCQENRIEQRFTKVKSPQTNGKAERVIRTLMDMWHTRTHFKNRIHRKTELIRFINWYNTVKPHQGLHGLTPLEQLTKYFYPSNLNEV